LTGGALSMGLGMGVILPTIAHAFPDTESAGTAFLLAVPLAGGPGIFGAFAMLGGLLQLVGILEPSPAAKAPASQGSP
jgi:hypothetical protein